MEHSMYRTNIQDSFLKALGPYQIQTTSITLPSAMQTDLTHPTQSITVGETKHYGERVQVGRKSDRREEVR
jgi:hypothetical protein